MSSYADVAAKNASQTPQEVRTNSSSLLSLFSKFKRRHRRSFAGNKSRRTVGDGQHYHNSKGGVFRTLSRALPSTTSSASSAKSCSHSHVVASPRSTSTLSQPSPTVRRRPQSIRSIQHKLSNLFSSRRRHSTSSSLTRLPSSVSTNRTRQNSYGCLSSTTITTTASNNLDAEVDAISEHSQTVKCSIVTSTLTVSTAAIPTSPFPPLLVAECISPLINEDCVGKSLTFNSSQKAAKPVPVLETTTTSTIAPSSMEPIESPPPPPAAETDKPADISSDKGFPEPDDVLPPSDEAPAGGPDKGKKAKSRECPFLVSAFDSLKKFVAAVRTDAAVIAYKAKTELRNPVVTCNLGTWVAIIAGATYYLNKKGPLPAAFTGPNGRYVTAAAITCALALTAGDVIVSTKKYPKYSKK
ncbi:hypothetical protein V1525DRAFT_400805 [Lipomyces kononenkoae]|uniref:Uncharacterized protein n=1 Tax=Lipomyces kononenkoae TaxID=34357 RepID=A0ACC3T3L9_LIPKO